MMLASLTLGYIRSPARAGSRAGWGWAHTVGSLRSPRTNFGRPLRGLACGLTSDSNSIIKGVLCADGIGQRARPLWSRNFNGWAIGSLRA